MQYYDWQNEMYQRKLIVDSHQTRHRDFQYEDLTPEGTDINQNIYPFANKIFFSIL